MGETKEYEVKVGLCKMCDHDQCHVKCILDAGRLERVETLHGSPFTCWFKIEQCPKQKGTIEQAYHKDRLNYPLKRIGERGSNKWETIPWDQAVDEIAEKLLTIKKNHGAEAVAAIYGFYNEQWDVARFMNLWGSPNTDSLDARICGGLEAWINIITYGGIAHYGPPDPRNTNLLVLWANRPSVTNPIKWDFGMRIPHRIVVDPRWVDECEGADMWIRLRPGTDAALALGWLNVIISEGLYDKEFVKKWVYGFDELKKRIQEYSPEKVSEICWVPAKQVIDSARLYASTKPAYLQWGSPSAYYGLNSGQTERAKCCLRAITGNLEVIGGNQIIRPYSKQVKLTTLEMPEKLSEGQMKKALGSDRFKVMTWPGWRLIPDDLRRNIRASVARGAPVSAIMTAARTGKPYPIKAMFSSAGNPMLVMSNTHHVYEAIQNLELFVSLEMWMTPTAVLADYVLPVTYWVERPQVSFLEHANSLITGQRVLPKKIVGKYDRWDDYDFWSALGRKVGQAEFWPWKNLEEVYDYRLAPTGIKFEEFAKIKTWDTERLPHKAYEDEGFKTPTGKVELFSTIYEKLGYDPLPAFEEPAESPYQTPDLAKEFPYIVISCKPRVYIHSSHRQVEAQRAMAPEPVCEIHPETAKKHGISDGDMMWIETKRGKIKQKAKYFDKMDPRVINPDFGWWFPEKEGATPSLFGVWEANVNVLTDDELDTCGQDCGNWYLAVHQGRVSKVN